MRNIDDIIFAVFNEDELDFEEEKLLEKENSDIFDFYEEEIDFQPELLTKLNITLQNRIKDIKTFCKCEECQKEFKLRYKYLPYLELDHIEFCDECIKDMALDYIALRKFEKHFLIAKEEHNKLVTFYSKKFMKITDIINEVIGKREEIGKWLSDYSNNYLMQIDRVSASYESDDKTVYISSNTDKGKLITNICDIKQFETLNVKYESDCKNIELRFEDYCKRPYYISKKGSYDWIVPKGMTLMLDSYYDGNYNDSEFDFV